uniref:Nuclease HARBI1 n=1 Tax=Triticum urartu TaxID=4572 RepID=A0A8R7URF2_TRIUA
MWGNFLKRKHREDDELAIIKAVYTGERGSTNRQHIHTSILAGHKYVREVLEGHELRCKRDFRMEKYVFHNLVKCFRERQLLQDERLVSVEEQVAIFLYTLSANASNRTLQGRFQHSGQTISIYFNKVLQSIMSLSGQLIQLPPINVPQKVSSNPKFMPYFQDCIGAIDGTHVPISISLRLQDPYRNRKGTLSQNVMVACNFDNQFVHVSAGWEGSASDARVLQDALENNFYVPEGKFYLVDAGYANTPNFIAPYRNVRYHLNEQARCNQRPQNAKELFNLRHAQLRNHIERIIGVVKKRFPVLKCASHYPIESQPDIVIACCALHNFIRNHEGGEQWFDQVGSNIDPKHIVDIPSGDAKYRSDVESLNERRALGRSKRDQIAEAMWKDYCEYLQERGRRNST